MAGEKALLRVIPTLQSAHLLGKVSSKKKKKNKIVSDAVKILTGIPLIKATAKQVESF